MKEFFLSVTLHIVVKRGASSRWSLSLYCPMRNTDQMAIAKTHPTLIRLLLNLPVKLLQKSNIKNVGNCLKISAGQPGCLIWFEHSLCWSIINKRLNNWGQKFRLKIRWYKFNHESCIRCIHINHILECGPENLSSSMCYLDISVRRNDWSVSILT